MLITWCAVFVFDLVTPLNQVKIFFVFTHDGKIREIGEGATYAKKIKYLNFSVKTISKAASSRELTANSESAISKLAI